MNICFLVGGFQGAGGIGRVTSLLANEMCKDSSKNIFVISYYSRGESNQYHLSNKINHCFLFDKPINMTNGILTGGIIKLRKYLKENDIDILIAAGTIFFPISVFSAINTKTKVICWEHSHSKNISEHPFQSLSRKVGVKYGDYVVTLTKADKENYMKEFNVNNIKHIYNPLDNELVAQNNIYEVNSKKIITVGRLTYLKNYELLIEIAKEVLKMNKDWEWHIYGDGELKNKIKEKIKDYNLESQLILKGTVENIYEVYSNYSFLVMTSRSEGFGMVLIEALSKKLPLISFDIEYGPNEIIIDRENGLLIKPFSQDEMISKINLLINDGDLRLRMSKNTENSVTIFRINNIVTEWYKLFDSLLK